MSRYQETVQYLYSQLPAFTRIGPAAYKANLDNIVRLCDALGNPQNELKYIHAAGTNGKGSCSHMLASVFQQAGYKTGLFTSPHLKDFRERIKINGIEIPEEDVIEFVESNKEIFKEIKPSFFEMTVALAFSSFHKYTCDIVVLETGLGGRLDSTNIITPEISLITNVSLDHTDLLGTTMEAIAFEKAGIIKNKIPVIISEATPLTMSVFKAKAEESASALYLAEELIKIEFSHISEFGSERFLALKLKGMNTSLNIESPLIGHYQQNNIKAVVLCCELMAEKGWDIKPADIEKGIRNVIVHTGLRGRWEKLGSNPDIYCDTGHNPAGIEEVMKQIKMHNFEKLHIVFGMMRDKAAETILKLLPTEAIYYFCAPDLVRALPATELQNQAAQLGLRGESYPSVLDAIETARQKAQENDMIYIGGSTFVVAEAI